MNNNIEVLEEILNVLEEEKDKFYNLVNENDFRIKEIDSYLKELSGKEEDDFKYFSPRNVENVHREQIEADTSDKKKYEEENEIYYKKIEFLKVLIDKVNIVITNLQIDQERREQEIIEKNYNEEKIVLDYNRKSNVVESAKDNVEDEIKNNVEKSKINNTEQDIIDLQDQTVNTDNVNMDIQHIMQENNLEKKHIAHQILNCVSFIVPDAERAKIELTALAKKMMEH